MREIEFGRADDACGSGLKYILQNVWWGSLKEADNLEDLDVDVRLIIKWILQK
jgi:hypothetical protein